MHLPARPQRWARPLTFRVPYRLWPFIAPGGLRVSPDDANSKWPALLLNTPLQSVKGRGNGAESRGQYGPILDTGMSLLESKARWFARHDT